MFPSLSFREFFFLPNLSVSSPSCSVFLLMSLEFLLFLLASLEEDAFFFELVPCWIFLNRRGRLAGGPFPLFNSSLEPSSLSSPRYCSPFPLLVFCRLDASITPPLRSVTVRFFLFFFSHTIFFPPRAFRPFFQPLGNPRPVKAVLVPSWQR